MSRATTLRIAGVLGALLGAPLAAWAGAAPPVAPCTTVTNTSSGVAMESCVPASTAAPLPVTIAPGAVSPGTAVMTAVTVGTTEAAITATNTAVNYVDFNNASPSNTVCIAFGTTATISGSTCSAGEWTIPPLWHASWPMGGASVLPPLPLHAIASGAGTPATVGVK